MTHESEVGAVDVWRVRLHYVPSMDLAARLVECCPLSTSDEDLCLYI